MFGKLFLTGFILLAAAASAQIFAQEKEPELNPVSWSIDIEKPLESLHQGDNFTAALDAKIESGWHLYALEKIEGGPIPTKISIADDASFELGEIDFPPPIEVDDAAFGVTTKFYEDGVKFRLPIKVLENFESGKSDLRIKIRFQTCNDQMCLPPKTVIVSRNSKQTSENNQ